MSYLSVDAVGKHLFLIWSLNVTFCNQKIYGGLDLSSDTHR